MLCTNRLHLHTLRKGSMRPVPQRWFAMRTTMRTMTTKTTTSTTMRSSCVASSQPRRHRRTPFDAPLSILTLRRRNTYATNRKTYTTHLVSCSCALFVRRVRNADDDEGIFGRRCRWDRLIRENGGSSRAKHWQSISQFMNEMAFRRKQSYAKKFSVTQKCYVTCHRVVANTFAQTHTKTKNNT